MDKSYSATNQLGAKEKLNQAINDITISMKALLHFKMAKLIIIEYQVTLSEVERAIYDMLRKDLVLEIPERQVAAGHGLNLQSGGNSLV